MQHDHHPLPHNQTPGIGKSYLIIFPSVAKYVLSGSLKDSPDQDIYFMLLFHSHSQVQRSLAQCCIWEMCWLNDYGFNSEIHRALLKIKGLITIMLSSITSGFPNVSYLQQFSSWLSYLQRNVLVVEQNSGDKRENAWVKVCLPLNLTSNVSGNCTVNIYWAISPWQRSNKLCNKDKLVNLAQWLSGH